MSVPQLKAVLGTMGAGYGHCARTGRAAGSCRVRQPLCCRSFGASSVASSSDSDGVFGDASYQSVSNLID